MFQRKDVLVATTSGTTQSVSGFGFTPKVILFWTANMQDFEGFMSHQSVMIGAVTKIGSNPKKSSGVYSGWLNGSTSANGTTYSPENDSYEIILGIGDGLNSRGTVTVDSDGFSVTWSSTPGAAAIIHYLAIGGSEITDATVVHDEFFGTGSQSITGQSFQPDFALFMTSYASYGTSQNSIGMGCAVSSTKRWAWNVNSLGGDTTTNWAKSMQRTDRCILCVDSAGADVEADFTSFNSDGLTLNIITNTSNFQYVAVLLKTTNHVDVGSFSKSSLGNSTINVTGGEPVAGMFCSINKPASTSLQADSKISIGGWDYALNKGHVWSGSTDGAVPSQANSYNETTNVISINDVTIIKSAASMGLNSSQMTLFWSPNDGGTEQILWFAFTQTTNSSGTIAMSGKKPFMQMIGYSFKGIIALAGAKPVLDLRAAVPVPPVSGSIAMASAKPTMVLSTYYLGADNTFGEGEFGAGEFGPLDYYGQIKLTAAKPTMTVVGRQGQMFIQLVGQKPVITMVGAEKFSGAIALNGKKPVIALSAGALVVQGSFAMAGKKPVMAVITKETFTAAGVLVGKKPVITLSGISGGWRLSMAGKKPVLAMSGTAYVLLNTATITMRSRTVPNNAHGMKISSTNRTRLEYWPRARRVGLVERGKR